MAANETVAERLGGDLKGINVTPSDTIKGWNDRRKSNNQIISALTPFVQLIGIFDEEEYKKMFSATESRTTVVFDDNSPLAHSSEYNKKYQINPNIYDNIREGMKERLINLYIVRNMESGLTVDPIEGIIMAETVSQAKDHAGGIGITDLQVDQGKSNIVGSRKFNLRMTINDIKLLDDRFEYSKLATFGAQFLVIYGWSNPDAIPGYDAAMSPPKLEPDPNETTATGRQRLIVPIRNLGNGGYWSAGRVNISKYDFAFNEMGKLEINIELRDDATLGMTSTVMSNISKKAKYFLQGDVFGKIIRDSQGNEFTLTDAMKARQQRLNKEYRESHSNDKIPEMSDAEYNTRWAATLSLADSAEVSVNEKGVEEVVSDLESDDVTKGATEAEAAQKQAEKNQPQKGYPDENAIFSFKEIFKTVVDTDPDLDGNTYGEENFADADGDAADDTGVASSSLPTKQIISYEKQPVYYFLGAIMDSVSLSMTDVNVGIGSSKIPAFYYTPVSEDSKLNTSFASNMQSENRKSSYEERIQEAVIRLKERFLPPAPRSMAPPFTRANYQGALGRETVEYLEGVRTAFRQTLGTATLDVGFAPAILSKKNYTSLVGGTSVVYEGLQTIEKNRVVNALFPPPPNVGQLIGAPMRGTRTMVDTRSGGNRELLRSKGLTPVGNLMCFIPDWKKEVSLDSDGNEVESFSGTADGFDPLDPTDYKAKDKGTLFYMVRSYDANKVVKSMERMGRAKGSVAGIIGTALEEIALKQKSTSGRVKINHIVTYDDWRLTDLNTWNLLQRKWHNLYREYLSSYFEDLIRKRVAELEDYGIPIEAIYNEVLDLDWLTGKIYNNASWVNGRRAHNGKHWLKGADEVYGGPAGSFNIGDAETKLNMELKKYRDVIAQSNLTLEGASQTDPIAVERGFKASWIKLVY